MQKHPDLAGGPSLHGVFSRTVYNPLNLEFLNQAKNISVIPPSSLNKISGKSVHVS